MVEFLNKYETKQEMPDFDAALSNALYALN